MDRTRELKIGYEGNTWKSKTECSDRVDEVATAEGASASSDVAEAFGSCTMLRNGSRYGGGRRLCNGGNGGIEESRRRMTRERPVNSILYYLQTEI